MKKIRLSQLLRVVFQTVIGIAPDRIKRLVFVASLSARLKKDFTALDEEALKNLNDAMNLGTDAGSLKAPVHFADILWDGKSALEICGEEVPTAEVTPKEVLQRVARHIAAQTPACMRYKNQSLEKDVETLLIKKSVALGS